GRIARQAGIASSMERVFVLRPLLLESRERHRDCAARVFLLRTRPLTLAANGSLPGSAALYMMSMLAAQALQHLRMTQLRQRARLNLTHALAGNAKLATHLLQRIGMAAAA